MGSVEELLKEYEKYCDTYKKILENKIVLDSFSQPYIPDPCKGCSNHPSNGGTGICHCILGSQTIY